MNVCVALAAALLSAAPRGAPSVEIAGVVQDETGRPVARARVALAAPAPDGTFNVFEAPFPGDAVRSDARGRFRIKAAPGPFIVVVSREIAGSVILRSTPVQVSDRGAKATVRFDGTATIRGRALGANGEPLAKVRLTALPERTGAAAARGDAIVVRSWTAADGSFVLSGLAPGEHRLLARGAGHNCVEACGYGQGLRARTGETVAVALERSGSIAGRVVTGDARSGFLPVPDFALMSPAFGWVPVEAEDGRFEVDVPRLWHQAPLFVIAPGLAPHATRFDLEEPIALELPEIELGPGRTVRGRVIDEVSGRPVEGAVIGLGYGSTVLEGLEAKTDARGEFELSWVPQEDAALSVRHPDYRPADVVARAGETNIAARLSAAVRLIVRVEDTDGTALPGAVVWSVISRTQCRTGADGTCVLTGLDRREQVLEARVPAAARPPMYQLRVPIGEAVPPPVTVRLARAPSVLRVTVVEPAGTFADASVVVVPGTLAEAPAPYAGSAAGRPHHTGGMDLQKRFDNLAPGPYTIVARSGDGSRCATQALELAPGADQSVVVKLPANRGPCRP